MKNKLQSKSFFKLSDDELLCKLSELLKNSRRVESELIAHIAEADRRRLHARYASSMFTFCTERLHLSENEAYLRIGVARASRRCPMLLEMLADGRLHLSGIVLLQKHLTESNSETVLERAAHKSKRQIEELVAELAPKPDVPTTMRKLPERPGKANKKRIELVPERVVLNAEPKKSNSDDQTNVETRPAAAPKKAAVKPIAPSRYKIEFTASAELRDKLERLCSLMRSSIPDGDFATLIEDAVTEKLERLEAKRFGKTKTPKKSLEETDTTPSSRYIPAPVRRAVYERDRGQCTYIDPTGRRCTETKRLEFHHLKPFGRGGNHKPSNIRLVCKSHNLYLAECDYGEEVMEKYRSLPNRVSEPTAVYAFSNRDTSRFDFPA